MRILLNKALLVVGLAVVMCGFAMQASAITFNFQEQAGFLVGTTGNLVSTHTVTPNNDIKWYSTTAAPVAPPAGEFNTIAWGRSNNAGALMVNDPFGTYGNTGSSTTNMSGLRVLGQQGSYDTTVGGWTTITELYHQNNPISSTYYQLQSATIFAILNIGVPPSYTDGIIDPNGIPITFSETLNSGTCADPVGVGGPACPDWWGFNLFGTGGSSNGFLPLTFGLNGNTYTVDFQIVAVTAGVGIEYTGTGIGGGDVRVWTQESVTSQMDVQMRITEQIPEPATLTLLGLGLLGLGLAKRRSMKKV